MSKAEKSKKTGKQEEQEINELAVFFVGLAIILAPALSILLLSYVPTTAHILNQLSWNSWYWFTIFPYIPISTFLVLYFYWAKYKIIGIFIEEGYCVIYAYGGQSFAGADLQYQGYYFDKDWNVKKFKDKKEKTGFVDDIVEFIKEPNRIRKIKRKSGLLGMNCYLWPFKRVYKYDLTWAKKTEEGERVSKSEKLSRVLLKPYVYSLAYESMEDADAMPLNIELAVEMQIINPIKALFGIEKWHRAILNLTEGYIRGFVGEHYYKELIRSKDKEGELLIVEVDDDEGGKKKVTFKNVGEAIFCLMGGVIKEIKDDEEGEEAEKKRRAFKESALGAFEEEYGARVKKIKVMQVVPSRKEDLEATLLLMRAEREKEYIVKKAEAKAIEISQELMGAVMQSLSEATNKSKADLQAEFNKEGSEKFEQKYGTAYKEAYDFAKRRMGFEKKGRFEFIVSGGNSDSGGTEDTGKGKNNIDTTRLIESVAGVLMAGQVLSQKVEGPQTESTSKDSSSDKKQAAVKKLKEELGYKY